MPFQFSKVHRRLGIEQHLGEGCLGEVSQDSMSLGFSSFWGIANPMIRGLTMSNPKKRWMQATFNPDRILDAILETFVEYDDWLTFRQLANRLTGDPSNEQVIAGIVGRHSRVLVVTAGCRCKLRTGFIEDAAEIASRQ